MGLSLTRRFMIMGLLLVSTIAQAQNKKVDSLKAQLKVHKLNDSTKVNLLYYLAFAHFQSDSYLTQTYLEKADRLNKELDYPKGKAKVFYLKGILENRKSNYNKSLDFFKQALAIDRSIDNLDGMAANYTAFGITYYDLSQYGEAIVFYNKAYETYKKIGNKREQATLLINMGNVYSEIGKYEEAVENYKKALVQSEALNDQDGVSFVHSNMANVYKVQGNFPLAIDYYNRALAYDRKTKDTLGMAIVLNDLGAVYSSIKKPEKALVLHGQSLDFSLKKGNKRLVAANNSNIGNIYSAKKEYVKALAYYQHSLNASQEIGDLKQIAICFNNIGAVNLSLGHSKKAQQNFLRAKEIAENTNIKNILAISQVGISEAYFMENEYKKALLYAKSGYHTSKELDVLETQKKALGLLAKIYERTKNYKKALESHQKFKVLNDSLFNKENIEKVARLEYEYKYKQALDSASIRELKLTKTVMTTSNDLQRTKQNYLWAIIGILVISILSGSLVFYQKYKNVKIKNQNIITEQRLLRSQMTPHFIFNSLSVLQGMILNKEEKKSITYLSKFSKLLRLVLENSRDKIVPLIQELDAIDNYMILQNLGAKPPYDYSLVVDENININLFLVPPMLIQPFIENAIEHAFSINQEHRGIEVHLSFKDKKLSCAITDNGIGIDAISNKINTKKKSLATTITSERLNLLAKDFNMPGFVYVEDRKKCNEQGTKVTLIIPYKIIKNS